MRTKQLQWLRLVPILLCLWSLACAQTYENKVVGVSDGDTLTVLMSGRQVKIRLAEIDAPEKRQPFGQRAKQSLSDLVYGKQVMVKQEAKDRYGRVVGRVYAGGLDVNAEQIRRGMAWVYLQYNRDKSLLALEQEAKSAKRGLWSEPNAIPPWEYRHGGRAGSKASSSAGSKLVQALAKAKASGSHQCGAKRYCNEMASCNEAKFYLNQCGLTRLDRDGDGVPCESLCR
jgi:endonuclease YncB( thermonuclease family)